MAPPAGAGSRIVAELVRRGHQVTAIARNPEKIEAHGQVTPKKGDLYDPGFSALLAGHDAVVSAVHFLDSDPDTLIEAVRAAGVKRYFVMGGAGSLDVAPGVKLIDTPEFPAIYKDEAAKGGVFLDRLRAGKGSRLDLPVAAGADRFRPTHRTIPARQGPASGRRQRRQQNLV